MNKIIISVVLAAVLLPVYSAGASSSNILPMASMAMPSLDIGAGARYIALGGAATALAGDAAAVEWNPGTLGYMRDIEINLEYKKWFMDSSMQHLTGTFPVGAGTFAAALSYVSMGTFEQLDEQGFLLGNSYSPMTIILSAGYGFKIPAIHGLSAGVTIRGAYQSIIDTTVLFGGLNLGLYYRLNDMFSFGLAGQNVGFMSSDPAPMNLRAGAAANLLDIDNYRITAMIDGYIQNTNGSLASVGLEAEVFEMAMLRFGYKMIPDNTENKLSGTFTAGAGVRIGVFKLDYAAQMFGDLGSNHTVSVGLLYKEMPKALTLKEYENILVMTYYKDAVTSYKMGDFEAAYTQMNRTLALSPKNKSVAKWVAYFKKAADAKKAKEDAAIAAGQVLQKQVIDSAYEQYKNNNYKKAVEIINTIQKGNPMYEKAALLLAQINDKTAKAADRLKDADRFLKAGDLINGVRNIRTAGVICPGCAEPPVKMKLVYDQAVKKANELYMEGITYYTQGNIKDAIESWEKVLILTPSAPNGKKSADNISRAKSKLKAIQDLTR